MSKQVSRTKIYDPVETYRSRMSNKVDMSIDYEPSMTEPDQLLPENFSRNNFTEQSQLSNFQGAFRVMPSYLRYSELKHNQGTYA